MKSSPFVGTFTHCGICVTDLDRSLRFYGEGLGFEIGECLMIDETFGHTLESPPGEVRVNAQFIHRGELTIELLHFESPDHQGVASSQRNMVGITHLAFQVEDLPAAVDHLVACGGTVIPSTTTTFSNDGGKGEVVFVADPDGVRVELAWLSDREAIMSKLAGL